MRTRLVVAALVLGSAGCSLLALAQEDPPASVAIAAGAGVSLSDQEAAAIPVASVTVEGPLYFGAERAPLRIYLNATFSGLPGDSVQLNDVQTFKAVGVSADIEHCIGYSRDGAYSYLLLTAGFDSRILPTDPAPLVRHARALGIGVAFEHREDDLIVRRASLVYGEAQVASQSFGKGQLTFKGQLRLFDVRKQVPFNLRLQSDLNMARHLKHGARDVTRAWVEVSYTW